MSLCTTCKAELEQERIGGTGRHKGRLVLLCATCVRVYPYETRPQLHLVEQRRDLA